MPLIHPHLPSNPEKWNLFRVDGLAAEVFSTSHQVSVIVIGTHTIRYSQIGKRQNFSCRR